MNKENKEANEQNAKSSTSLAGLHLAKLESINAELLAALTNILARVEASPTLLPHISADVRSLARAAIAKAQGV